MLQPINTVLPTIAADPYSVNVAIPQTSPLDTEIKLQQIESSIAQRRAQEVQMQQSAANIQLQRERMAQEKERFEWDKQKYQDTQLTELEALRNTTFTAVDNITKLPFYSETDRTFIEQKVADYELTSEDLTLLNTGAKSDVYGVQTKLRQFYSDPEVRKYIQNATAYKVLTDNAAKDPKKYNIGAINELGKTVLTKDGIMGISSDVFTPTNYITKPSAFEIFTDNLKVYKEAMGSLPIDSDSQEVFLEALSADLNNAGLEFDKNANLGFLNGIAFTTEEIQGLSESLADQLGVDPSAVFDVFSRINRQTGKQGVNTAAQEFLLEGIKGQLALERARQTQQLKNEGKNSGGGGGDYSTTGVASNAPDISKLASDTDARIVLSSAQRLNKSYSIPFDEQSILDLKIFKERLIRAAGKDNEGFLEDDDFIANSYVFSMPGVFETIVGYEPIVGVSSGVVGNNGNLLPEEGSPEYKRQKSIRKANVEVNKVMGTEGTIVNYNPEEPLKSTYNYVDNNGNRQESTLPPAALSVFVNTLAKEFNPQLKSMFSEAFGLNRQESQIPIPDRAVNSISLMDVQKGIGSKESNGDYNALRARGQSQPGLNISGMSLNQIKSALTDNYNADLKTSYVGKYQFNVSFLENALTKYNIPLDQPLTPRLQDRLFYDYYLYDKQPNVKQYIRDGKDEDKAVTSLMNEFTSIKDREEARSYLKTLREEYQYSEQVLGKHAGGKGTPVFFGETNGNEIIGYSGDSGTVSTNPHIDLRVFRIGSEDREFNISNNKDVLNDIIMVDDRPVGSYKETSAYKAKRGNKEHQGVDYSVMKGSEIAINESVFTPDGEPTMGYQKDGAGVYTYITGTYIGPNTQLNGKKLKVQVMHLDPVHSARKLNESGNDLPWDKVDATKADKYSNPTPYVFVEPGQSENVAQAPKPEPPFSPEEVRSRISAAESTGSNSNKAYAVATEAQEFSNRGMNDESLRAFGKALEYADKIEDEKERIKVRRNIEAAKDNIMQQNRNRVSGSNNTNAAPRANTPNINVTNEEANTLDSLINNF
jgi:hypothetical protein